jgi:hypothetical protein
VPARTTAVGAHPAEELEPGGVLTEERPAPAEPEAVAVRRSWPVLAVLAIASVGAVVLGFLPQYVLWAADGAARLLLP